MMSPPGETPCDLARALSALLGYEVKRDVEAAVGVLRVQDVSAFGRLVISRTLFGIQTAGAERDLIDFDWHSVREQRHFVLGLHDDDLVGVLLLGL